MRSSDLAIIGAGPAGLAAALQARRDATEAIIVADEPPGGLIGAARMLNNLPGFPGGITGQEYQRKLAAQAGEAGLEIAHDKAVRCVKGGRGYFIETEAGGTISCRCLILACGTEPIPFTLHGLNHAEEGGRFHRDVRTLPKDLSGAAVAVIGGGEAALDSALTVRDRGGKATVLARGSRLRSAPLLERMVEEAGLEIVFGCVITRLEVLPDCQLQVKLERNGDSWRKQCDYLLACIGRQPRLELWSQLGGQSVPAGVITGLPGVLAAGDLIRSRDRYVVPAQGDGAVAACAAAEYLSSQGIAR